MPNEKPSLAQLLHRLNTKLIAGLLSALLVVGIPFFAFFYYFHRNQLIEGLKSSTSSLSRLVVGSLESAMTREVPHLLQEEVALLSRQSGVVRIMLLDHRGEVRVSSDPSFIGSRLDPDRDPTCRICHNLDRKIRESTTLVQDPSGELFRNMTPIRNQSRCHGCHSPGELINGLLILDLSTAPIRERLNASFRWMLVMAGTMGLLTVLALGILMRRLVLRRVGRFMRATSLVRQGKLEETVPVDSSDELGRLAESFNVMTVSLRTSVEELKTQSRFLEDVMNSIRDEIVVFDPGERAIRANDAAKERGASTPSHLVAETFRSGSPGSTVRTVDEPGGGRRTEELRTYPLVGPEGKVFQVIQVARDITERRYLEAQLRHSERLASLGLLASGVSHEINNPLASVGAAVEGLIRMGAESTPSPAQMSEMREYLLLIRGEVERASSITHRLLALCRPSGGEPSLIDVSRVLSDTVSLLRHRARQRDVEISETPNGVVHPVKGDESGLRQVLLNLLLNALDAIDTKGRIEVGVKSVPDGVNVSIRDNGRGIAREDTPHIFEPFFSRKAGRGGTGLGLFIARSIIDQMGGHIGVESTLGQGTEFSVFLPATGREPLR